MENQRLHLGNFRSLIPSLFMFFLLFAINVSLNAQNFLIKGSTTAPSALSNNQLSMYNRIIDREIHSDHYLVEFLSLSSNQNNGEVNISIPGVGCDTLKFLVKDVEYRSDSDYTWYGNLKQYSEDTLGYCENGSLTLVSSNSGRIGHLFLDDNFYEIAQLGGDLFLLSLIDSNYYSVPECGNSNNIDSLGMINSDNYGSTVEARNHIVPCLVKCLVLYTENALAEEGSVSAIENRARLGILQSSQTFYNSTYGQSFRIRLVATELLDAEFEESNNIEDDLKNNLSILGEAQRIAHEADVVIVLTSGEYAALGQAQSEIASINNRYASVQTTFATGIYVFTHELGHLFGGGHEDDPRPGITHGLAFYGKKNNIYSTVMDVVKDGEDFTRILYFSNSIFKYDSGDMGDESYYNNALEVSNNFCDVAEYTLSQEPPSILISGNEYMCPCQYNTLTASMVSGSEGVTYSFEWFISYDGINWSGLTTGAGSYGVVTMPCEVGRRLFLRVVATGTDSSTTSATYSVESATTWPDQQGPCTLTKLNDDRIHAFSLHVYPNPSNLDQTVHVTINKKQKYSATIYDANGKLIETLINNQTLHVGTEVLSLKISTPGVYFLRVEDSSGMFLSEKIIKL